MVREEKRMILMGLLRIREGGCGGKEPWVVALTRAFFCTCGSLLNCCLLETVWLPL